MSIRTIRPWRAALPLAIIALGSALPAVAEFSQVYVFGDSLSDPGNVYALTGETSKAPYLPIPSAPYATGGHHFSNGKTWVERFAQDLNVADGGRAALAAPGKNGNYAFGGARARAAGDSPSSSVQIGMFLGDYGAADADALYVLQFGGNDIRDALFDPANAGMIVLQAVAAEISGIQALYLSGAREFVVANAPNLARAPAVVAAGPAAIAGAESLSQFHNTVLESGYAPLGLPGLAQLEALLPGIHIRRLDLYGFVDDAVADPQQFGLSDPFFPCLMFGTQSEAKCDNPDERLFWDGIHPTAAGHTALAAVATQVVTE